MKKILILLITIISLLGLSSCDIQISDPNITIDQIESENVDIIQIQNQLTKTIAEVSDQCVGVISQSDHYKTIGSGVIYKIIDRKTNKPATEETVEAIAYVVTNEHVIKPKEKGTTYRVYLGTERYYFADCIGSDTKNDLAVLTFNVPLNEKTISFDDFANIAGDTMDFPAIGSYAIAIGCPLTLDNFNYPTFGLVGNVSLLSITHSAPINPGNSGGGLFNTSGRLIGINVSKKAITEDGNTSIPVVGIARAIPIWTVKKVINEIETINDEIVRPELGANLAEINSSLNPEDSNKLPAEINQGVIVKEVYSNTNADKLEGYDEKNKSYLGLSTNDIITELNGKAITKAIEVEFYLSQLRGGSELKLKVYRLIDGEWKVINFKGKLKA